MTDSNMFYLVKMRKGKRCFIITTIRRDEFSNPAVFHGVGFWGTVEECMNDNNEDKEIVEVWIPWDQIDHVESLVYRPRS